MEYTQELILDLNSNAAYTTVGAKQSDHNSRVVKVHIVENGEEYNLVENGVDAAYFRFRKPDGKAIINPAKINEDNTITIVFTSQTLSAPGRGYGDVTLMQGSTILSTVSFIVVIMASPQVAQEAISGNEFGYLQAIVDDSNHIIYEAQAWAVGQRGRTDVYSENSFNLAIKSGRIIVVPDPPETVISTEFDELESYLIGEYVWHNEIEDDHTIHVLYKFIKNHVAGPWDSSEVQRNQTITQFFKNVGTSPGLKRIFKFVYQDNGAWLLYRTQIEGITETKYDGEAVTNIEGTNGYFPGFVYNPGFNEPGFSGDDPDEITVTICEADNTYQNNAKYYANLANERKQAIENLTASAEVVYADEFVEYKNYSIGDYVWYPISVTTFSNQLDYNIGDYVYYTINDVTDIYRFTRNHSAGNWNPNEVNLCEEAPNGKQLYRYISNHTAGAWNQNEVIEESIIEKDLLSSPTHFHFKVPQGPVGDVNFVTFDIDPISGELLLNSPDYTNPRVKFSIGCYQYSGPSSYSIVPSRINDGDLYVEILYGD